VSPAPRGPFIGFIITLVMALVVLSIIYAADIASRALERVGEDLARALNVPMTTEYSRLGDQAVTAFAVIIGVALLFTLVVYAVHIKRR